MKIRILGNSLRLRVSQSDLDVLAKEGKVVEKIQFPGGTELIYSLQSSNLDQLDTQFDGKEVSTFIPNTSVEEWVNSNRVGFEGFAQLPNEGQLKILIEKDFKCLTDRGEDESNLFANPNEEKC